MSCDELLREADPARGRAAPDAAQVEAALAAVLRRTHSEPRRVGHPGHPRHPRRRWAPAALAASLACAAAIALLLINVLPGGTPGAVRAAWAKQVIVKASAAMLRGVRAPLYTDVVTVDRGGAATRYRTTISRDVTWQYGTEMRSTTWILRPRPREIEESTVHGRNVDVYVAATNTIREYRNPAGGSIVYTPVYSTLMMVDPFLVKLHFELTAAAAPSSVVRAMLALMHSPGLRVHRSTLAGKPVIRLSDRGWSGWVDLDPRTYLPREIYRTDVPGTASHGGQAVIFNAYRTVPRAQLPPAVFNLRLRHPSAQIKRITP